MDALFVLEGKKDIFSQSMEGDQFQYAVHAHRRLFHPKPDSKSGSGNERGSMAVPEQFRLWYHAGDFRRVAAVWPDHRIKSGSHRYHPSFGGYASDGSDLEAFVYLLCVYLVFYGVLLLSAASVPAFDCQVHGMRHLAGLQRTFENHSLAVCILLLTILSVSVDSAVKTPSKRRHKILF